MLVQMQTSIINSASSAIRVELIQNESKTEVDGPQTHFHADVIKRVKQNILTVKDHFSSFQDAILIESETARDLCDGIIVLTSGIRRPSQIYISVDNSPGFKSLITNPPKELDKLKITLIKTDDLNKNANAVIDKGCQELESEIKQLEPEGGRLTNAVLKQAVLNLNSKLRRRGNISAFEINCARDQVTGENLSLNDNLLRENQINKRKEMHKEISKGNSVEVGDTVKLKNQSDKHKADDIFIVTSKHDDEVGVQKLLHPLSKAPPKFMGKIHNTKQKLLHTVHRPMHPKVEGRESSSKSASNCPKEKVKQKLSWTPINPKFFNDDDDDESDDDNSKTESNTEEIPRDQASDSDTSRSSDNLEWDDSPEQYQLDGSLNEEFEETIRPRRLFSDTKSSAADDDLTSEDLNDDEVFERDAFATPPSAPKLTRSNAMRKEKPVTIDPDSEPRVTRRMFLDPTSPYNVNLNARQNLANVLDPRAPIIPEVVELGPRVQNLNLALEHVGQGTQRRSARVGTKDPVNYKKLHNEGRQ